MKVVDESRIVAAGGASTATVSAAWRHSSLHALAHSLLKDAAALDVPKRFRLAGVALGSALLTNVALSLFGGTRWLAMHVLCWLFGAVAALVLLARPSTLAAAWIDRRR